MAFAVVTVNSEDDLAAALTATVTTFRSIDELSIGLAAATDITEVVVKGYGYFTLIDDAQITNVSLRIMAKGAKFTYILETV